MSALSPMPQLQPGALSPAWHTQQQLSAENVAHVVCQQTEEPHSDEASRLVQLMQDFTLSSSGEHSCDFFHPAQPQPSGMEQLNVAAIVAQAQHLQGWCAQLELQLQAKDTGALPLASPPGHVYHVHGFSALGCCSGVTELAALSFARCLYEAAEGAAY